MFWAIATVLALGTAGLIAGALLRGRASAEPAAAYDLRIYRDQLAGVERDVARGTVTEAEAGRLRTEVSRRILTADAQLAAHEAGSGQPRRAGAIVAAGLALAVTAGTLAGYLALGAPGYGDMPRAARLAASDKERSNRLSQDEAVERFGPDESPIEPEPEFADLMRKLREALDERPNDVRGLTLLARNEASLGNTRAAQDAQARLIAAKGEQAEAGDHAFLADLMITAAGGYVSADAEAALRTALAKDPDLPEARYYLGVYFTQVDRPDAAFRLWSELLEESPPDAPWVAPLRARLGAAAARAGVRYQLPPEEAAPRGPSADDIAAAEDMSEDGRKAFIAGMVDSLLERLAAEGGPPEEWARAITSLGVMGKTERAAAIWDEAQGTFQGRPEALKTLRAAARDAGVLEGAE